MEDRRQRRLHGLPEVSHKELSSGVRKRQAKNPCSNNDVIAM